VPPRERAVDRGSRRGKALVSELGRELRTARVGHGLTQASVGGAIGLSRSEVSRIERGAISSVSILNLARLMSVVGLELSARAYPTGAPLRDRAHLALIGRLRDHVAATLSWRVAVPIGPIGNLRAWDVIINLGRERIGVEAETRLTDLQSIERRIALKCRDSAIPTAILLLADTRTNRLALRSAGAAVPDAVPIRSRDALRSLRSGELPTANALVLL
jgi:transcriptional regulator with XRE-family HTH domain